MEARGLGRLWGEGVGLGIHLETEEGKRERVSMGGFASRLPIHCVECVKSVSILLKRLIKWKFSLKGS